MVTPHSAAVHSNHTQHEERRIHFCTMFCTGNVDRMLDCSSFSLLLLVVVSNFRYSCMPGLCGSWKRCSSRLFFCPVGVLASSVLSAYGWHLRSSIVNLGQILLPPLDLLNLVECLCVHVCVWWCVCEHRHMCVYSYNDTYFQWLICKKIRMLHLCTCNCTVRSSRSLCNLLYSDLCT